MIVDHPTPAGDVGAVMLGRIERPLARATMEDHPLRPSLPPECFGVERCERFYAKGVGRRGIAPGIYFRMLMIAYFEGIDSERGIAWRCADSLGLREFLGFSLAERTPDHSSLSVIRNRIDLETHQEIFDFVLGVLKDKGLIKGMTVGVDATTLEAFAAMRSIVRRDTGEAYREFFTHLAEESGIETPTRDDLIRLDRTRKKKARNDDWEKAREQRAVYANRRRINEPPGSEREPAYFEPECVIRLRS